MEAGHINDMERMISEVRQPLAQAVALLSQHSSEIRTNWIKLLKRYNPDTQHAAALSRLHLALLLGQHGFSYPRKYREEFEHEGQDLARGGVPAESAATAVDLYVESCLPFLSAGDRRESHWRRAFLRLASVYRSFLLAGHAQRAAAEFQTLEERVNLAERRSQGFAVELGDAYEKERRRLAQDLHDEIGHDLIVLKLYTQVIALDLKKGDIDQVRRKLKESVSLINHALKGVRHLTFDLGPAIWNEQGFLPAVKLYARQFARRTGLKVRFDARRLSVQLPGRYETALYKALQGALSNVAAHAGAQHVKIALASRYKWVVMTVEDDGKGFNPERKLKTPRYSYGLRAMRDRIELLGGTIHFASWPSRRAAKRRGTVIEFNLPLHEVEQHETPHNNSAV
jgi:signal transduction histidine kinase